MTFRQNCKVLLASSSKVRREFLQNIGLNVNIVNLDFSEEEILNKFKTRDDLVSRVSKSKMEFALDKCGRNELILTADTLVRLNKVWIGKLKNREEAYSTILSYSDKLIEVYTSFSLYLPKLNNILNLSEKSFIKFTKINRELAHYYISLGFWNGRAGGINLQNGSIEIMVEYIKGSYSNIIGLPIKSLYDIFIKENIISV